MFLVVLGLCIASCLAAPSIGYTYPGYTPLSHSYAPYQSLLTPYALNAVSYPHVSPLAYSAPVPVAHAPVYSVGIKTQYHTEDLHGQSSYGHSEPLQSHHAVQDVHGNKVGSFSYVKPDGQVHRTDYVADAAGYRVASNDLPVGPASDHVSPPAVVAVPHETPLIVDAAAVPLETPEIIAAKAAHFVAHAHAHDHVLYKRSIYPYSAPVVTPSGHLADTPEVAAAKQAHFAEHAKHGGNHYASPYGPPSSYYTPSSAYYGPYAAPAPIVNPHGYLADTPEVAAAKAAHFAEKAKVSPHYNAIPVSHAAAYPYLAADGHVLETPEVVAAKNAHFAEHAAVNARNAALDSAHGPVAYSPYAPHASYVPHSSYAPLASYPSSHSAHYEANPVVLPNGHLADTPEVAHAKAAHFAEYASVASRQKRSVLLGQTPANTVPLVSHHLSYVAPVAPVVPVAPVSPYAYAHPHAYAQPSVVPHAYSLYPFLKPATHTAIVHGPHAVSYSHHI